MAIKGADMLEIKPIILYVLKKSSLVMPPGEKVYMKCFKVTVRVAMMLSFC